MDVFSIVHGSLGPRLHAVLKTDGVPQNLTGATVTLFAERRSSGQIWINGAAVTIVDAPNGVVEYSWQNADWTNLEANTTLGDGMYRAQWNVTGLSPTPVRFPTELPGFFGINVEPKTA